MLDKVECRFLLSTQGLESEIHFYAELYRSRALCAPGNEKICIIAVYKLRTKTKDRIVEQVEHVNGRANPYMLTHINRSRSAQVDSSRPRPLPEIAWQVSALAYRRKHERFFYVCRRGAFGPSPNWPTKRADKVRAVVLDIVQVPIKARAYVKGSR